MAWTDHTDEKRFAPEGANAEETLLWALGLDDPRSAEDAVVYLDRHRGDIEQLLHGRGRWAVLRSEKPMGWLMGALGFVGPLGLMAFALGIATAWLFSLPFGSFVVWSFLYFVLLRLAIVRPDHRDWLSVGTPLGAGVVAAWAIRNHGEASRAAWDEALSRALVKSPEYWHDLAARAVERLPLPRREKLVLAAFSARPDDLWHLLPLAPTDAVVRAALARGPRSSATADFHAFQTLIRSADVRPVLNAIRTGARNRDVLIRAVAASGNPAAADLLVATLAEKSAPLRSVARDGLVAMGPVVLPKLFEAFELQNPRVQLGVARALRGLGVSADIERFCARALEGDCDPEAAAELRRAILSRRVRNANVALSPGEGSTIDHLLASIPAPPHPSPEGASWLDGTPVSDGAYAVLVDLVTTEGPSTRCPELARIGTMLAATTRAALMERAREGAERPAYRMVLADEAELLNHHVHAVAGRQDAEEWVDILERHASLAAIHALDDLWRTGVDGVVQTSAMAALMRITGHYDGLESFADEMLRGALADVRHPLYPRFAAGQFSRFEQMMIGARRVDVTTFHRLFHTVPARHVLWGAYDGSGALLGAFRLDEDYEAVDADDEPFLIEQCATVGIVHPAELGPAASRRWADVFSDYELVPHFEQIQRPACHLASAQMDDTSFTAFDEAAPGDLLEAALIQRGWRPSPMDIETVFSLTKPIQRGRAAFTAIIEIDPGFGEDPTVEQRIEGLAFTEGHHHVMSPVVTKVRLGAVDAVIFSEIVLELRDVLYSAATGEARSIPDIPAADFE